MEEIDSEESPEIDSKPSQTDLMPETVEEPVKKERGDLTRLTMSMLNAIGEWSREIERRTK